MTTEELAAAWIDRFGADAVIEETFGDLAADVPAASWLEALEFARDGLECSYFDWLTGVDELEDGFRVVTHLYSLEGGHHLLIRTLIPRESPVLPSAVGVFRGANWHERETYEMFGIVFEGHPDLKPLLLPDGFEGNPLRKDFVLAARVAKAWPGAKEPGESGGAPSRRKNLPPGVPANWGPAAAEPPKAPERRRPSAAAEARHKPPAAPSPAAPSSAPQESVPAAPASVPHEPTAPVEPPVAGSTETRGKAPADRDPATPPPAAPPAEESAEARGKPPADREPATPSPAAPSAAGQGPEAGAEGSAEAGVTSGEVGALDEPQAADGEGGDERA